MKKEAGTAGERPARPKLTQEHFTRVPDLDFPPDKIKEGMEVMERQVVELAPALVDIARQALKEKPQYIVCADKSARIFGVPLCRFIERDLQAKIPPKDRYNPHLTFFNDDFIKDNIIKEDKDGNLGVSIEPDMARRIAGALAYVKGQRFFFIDEILALGRSLRSLLEEVKLANVGLDEKINVHFFSLAQIDDPSHGGRIDLAGNWKEFLAQTLSLARSTDNFEYTLCENHLQQDLFSHSPLFRYVITNNWRTKPINNLLVTLEEMRHTPEFGQQPEGVRKEFVRRTETMRQAIPQVMRSVSQAKKKLYQAMQQSYGRKTAENN